MEPNDSLCFFTYVSSNVLVTKSIFEETSYRIGEIPDYKAYYLYSDDDNVMSGKINYYIEKSINDFKPFYSNVLQNGKSVRSVSSKIRFICRDVFLNLDVQQMSKNPNTETFFYEKTLTK